MSKSLAKSRSCKGVALILVLFIVALASVLVISLTYTANLEARSNLAIQRGLKAEYLLKSAVSFAQSLIKQDQTFFVDGTQDVWAQFKDGAAIPPALLGIEDPALKVELEIRPEDAKIQLRSALNGDKWLYILANLYKELGFEEDNEEDHTGYFPGRQFKPNDMVAALHDYMDKDDDNFNINGDSPFPGVGIENDLPKGVFPNRKIERVGELASIPGYSPARMQKLMPFVRVFGGHQSNINLAPKIVLKSMDSELGDDEVQNIIDFRASEDGPFCENSPNLKVDLQKFISDSDLVNRLGQVFGCSSTYFQVIAKVDYGSSTYFMRAYLHQAGDGQLPRIKSVELF